MPSYEEKLRSAAERSVDPRLIFFKPIPLVVPVEHAESVLAALRAAGHSRIEPGDGSRYRRFPSFVARILRAILIGVREAGMDWRSQPQSRFQGQP